MFIRTNCYTIFVYLGISLCPLNLAFANCSESSYCSGNTVTDASSCPSFACSGSDPHRCLAVPNEISKTKTVSEGSITTTHTATEYTCKMGIKVSSSYAGCSC
jgi:hypothetical protein